MNVTCTCLTLSLAEVHAEWDSSAAVTKGNKQAGFSAHVRSRALTTARQNAPSVIRITKRRCSCSCSLAFSLHANLIAACTQPTTKSGRRWQQEESGESSAEVTVNSWGPGGWCGGYAYHTSSPLLLCNAAEQTEESLSSLAAVTYARVSGISLGFSALW
jgi:hypothetical protein